MSDNKFSEELFSAGQEARITTMIYEKVIIGGIGAAIVAGAVAWIVGTAVPVEKAGEISDLLSDAETAKNSYNEAQLSAEKKQALLDAQLLQVQELQMVEGWPVAVICSHENDRQNKVFLLSHHAQASDYRWARYNQIGQAAARYIELRSSDFEGVREGFGGEDLRDRCQLSYPYGMPQHWDLEVDR